MLQNLLNVLKNNIYKYYMIFKDEKINIYLISIIWGLGISTLFRKICDDNRCIVVKAPNLVQNNKKINGKCYEFVKEEVKCENFDNFQDEIITKDK